MEAVQRDLVLGASLEGKRLKVAGVELVAGSHSMPLVEVGKVHTLVEDGIMDASFTCVGVGTSGSKLANL